MTLVHRALKAFIISFFVMNKDM